MNTRRIIKVVLLYLVIGNIIGLGFILSEYIYHRSNPSVKSYRSFVLDAMAGDPRRYNNFKATNDYTKLMNTGSVDSVRFYYDIYKHSE